MKYIYGPVPSRRLGRSLGIDPFAEKTCSNNCVYCQLGCANPVNCESKIEGVSPREIENELTLFFESGNDTDFISFAGNGEPTLWLHLKELCEFIKAKFAAKKLAIITNSTTLWRKDVREAICIADLAVPTISSADAETYKKLHRPFCDDFERHIQGIMQFAMDFKNEIWAEVMLVAGINDSDEHLTRLAKFLEKLPIAHIDLNTPVRTPAEKWVRCPDENRLRHACEILGEKCRIVGKFSSHSRPHDEETDINEKRLSILKRRPETAEAMASSLHISIQEVKKSLSTLIVKGQVTGENDGYYHYAKQI